MGGGPPGGVADIRRTHSRGPVHSSIRPKIHVPTFDVCTGRDQALGAAGAAIYLVRSGGVVLD